MSDETAKPRPAIVELSGIAPVPCPCGTARRAFADLPGAPCTLHMTEISRDSRTHYPRAHTEVYYILAGRGRMELDGELHDVTPGTAILVPPGTRHRAIPGEAAMTILNFVTPPFDPADEHFD